MSAQQPSEVYRSALLVWSKQLVDKHRERFPPPPHLYECTAHHELPGYVFIGGVRGFIAEGLGEWV